MEYYGVVYTTPLQHHGIKGQKWGIRRWQNPDGTLTPAGMAHYKKKLAKLNTNINQTIRVRQRYYKEANEALRDNKSAFDYGYAREKQYEWDQYVFDAEVKFDDLLRKIEKKYGVDVYSKEWDEVTSKAIRRAEERGRKAWEDSMADTEAAKAAYNEYLKRMKR